jgi:alkylation response protein AidB-like acyl-CoA dehydrogenase
VAGPQAGGWTIRQLRSRGNTIEAGTSEVLRSIIAERVLGLPRSR